MPAAVRCVGQQRVALLRTDGGITRCERQAISSCVEILARPAMHSLYIGDPVFGKFQPCVKRSHAVAGVRKIAAREKAANVGLIPELARHAHHLVRRSRVVRTAGESQSRLAVIDRQRAQGPSAELSRHARAKLRVGNLAREKEIDRRDEKSSILNKERTLLRKE